MKKLFGTLLVAFALMSVAPAQAQVKLGVVGGLNLTKLSYDKIPDVSSDNRCGWYFGPKIEFTVPIIGLGADIAIEYSQRRLNQNVDALTSSTSTTTSNISDSKYYKTIEIPINVRYEIGLPSLASLYVATGPQFGFNVGSKNWNWYNTDNYKLKSSNVTWNIGIGAKLINHLEVGAGYNIALSKFASKYAGDGTFKANTWQLQVAYMF